MVGGLLPTSSFGTRGLLNPNLGYYRVDNSVIKMTLNDPYGETTFLFSLYDAAQIGLFFLAATPYGAANSKLAVIGFSGAKVYINDNTICIAPNSRTNNRMNLLPLSIVANISKIETITYSDLDNIKSGLVEINPQNLL